MSKKLIMVSLMVAGLTAGAFAWAQTSGVATASSISGSRDRASACDRAIQFAEVKVPYGANVSDKRCECGQNKSGEWMCEGYVNWRK